MGMKRTQVLQRQKANVEQALKSRLAFLSGKGIASPEAEKDTLVRKHKGDIKAVNKRLRSVADNEKRIEEVAKAKAEKAAAPRKDTLGAKREKPKKGQEEGKGKKAKPEKKAAAPKAPEGGQPQAAAGSSEEGKAPAKE